MENNPSANLLSTSVRVYRNMLAAYPQRFLEKYETQMVQVFRDSFREAHQNSGIPGAIDLWLHTIFDLVFTAFIERVLERSKNMFSPKVTTWGGLAGVLGGFMWLIMSIAPSAAAFVLAFVLTIGGLAGIYSWQAGNGGKLGSTGFVLGILGTTLAIGTLSWGFASGNMGYIATPNDAVRAAPYILTILLSIAIVGIGLVLIGIAAKGAESRPRWWGLTLALGVLTILQSYSMWLAYYVPMSHAIDPWSRYYDNALWFPSIVWGLAGASWIGVGFMLMRDASSQGIQTHQASA